MRYEIENLSTIEKQVTVDVPMEEVEIAIGAVIGIKRKSFDKRGFHQAKILDNLIFMEQQEEILAQTTRQILDVHIKEAQRVYDLNPINLIRVQSEAPLTRGEAFRFRFVAEVIPDLDIPELKSRTIEVKRVDVSEAHIDEIISSLREQLSVLKPIIEKRKPLDGDVVSFDFESLGEFKSVMGMSGTNHKLELGTGDTIRDFESILKSLVPGETKTAPVTYPLDFPNTQLAGKHVETAVTLKAINQKILPEVNELFAQKIARVGTVLEMRVKIKQRHSQRLTLIYKQEAQRRLLDDIMKDIEVPLSAGYVEQNLNEMIGGYTMSMQQHGMTTVEISGQIDQKRREFLSEAETAAKRHLFLLAVAKKEQIKLDRHEVESEIIRQAEAAETDPVQFMLDAQQSGIIRNIKDSLMMRKVVSYIYEQADKRIVGQITNL